MPPQEIQLREELDAHIAEARDRGLRPLEEGSPPGSRDRVGMARRSARRLAQRRPNPPVLLEAVENVIQLTPCDAPNRAESDVETLLHVVTVGRPIQEEAEDAVLGGKSTRSAVFHDRIV